jgi:acyl-coenzyme A thioesterase PaaI-like protein
VVSSIDRGAHYGSEPVKIGRKVSVWQTRIRTAEGRDVALVTQTQLAL